jgi:predicted RNase H-like nuclease (RuvC/YqgF family)
MGTWNQDPGISVAMTILDVTGTALGLEERKKSKQEENSIWSQVK